MFDVTLRDPQFTSLDWHLRQIEGAEEAARTLNHYLGEAIRGLLVGTLAPAAAWSLVARQMELRMHFGACHHEPFTFLETVLGRAERAAILLNGTTMVGPIHVNHDRVSGKLFEDKGRNL